MYICDRPYGERTCYLVKIFVAIRYRVSTVFQREISFVFKKTWYKGIPVPTYGYLPGTQAMYKSLPLNLSRE